MGPGPSSAPGAGVAPAPPPNSFGGFTPYPYNIPPNDPQSASTKSSSSEKKDLNTSFIQEEGAAGGEPNADVNIPPPSYDSLSPDDNLAESNKPKPQPRSKIPPHMGGGGAGSPTGGNGGIPDLPNVPLDLPDIPDDTNNSEEIDFDDLSRRFEELKKRK